MVNKAILLALILVSCITTLKANAEVDRHPRPLLTNKLERVGLSVEIPARPNWPYEIIENGETDRIMISTPENYYPVAQIQKQFFPRMRVSKADLKQAAIASHNKTRKLLGVTTPVNPDELKYIATGDITGWADTVDIQSDGQWLTTQSIFATFTTDQPVHIMIGTPKGQIEHVALTVSIMLKYMAVLPKFRPENLSKKK